jgi:hypothetical protein
MRVHTYSCGLQGEATPVFIPLGFVPILTKETEWQIMMKRHVGGGAIF